MAEPSDTAACSATAHDADDVGARHDGRIVVLLWDDSWPAQIAALRQRSADRIRLGPWTVTAPLDGGLIVEGPPPLDRADFARGAVRAATDHLRAFALRVSR